MIAEMFCATSKKCNKTTSPGRFSTTRVCKEALGEIPQRNPRKNFQTRTVSYIISAILALSHDCGMMKLLWGRGQYNTPGKSIVSKPVSANNQYYLSEITAFENLNTFHPKEDQYQKFKMLLNEITKVLNLTLHPKEVLRQQLQAVFPQNPKWRLAGRLIFPNFETLSASI